MRDRKNEDDALSGSGTHLQDPGDDRSSLSSGADSQTPRVRAHAWPIVGMMLLGLTVGLVGAGVNLVSLASRHSTAIQRRATQATPAAQAALAAKKRMESANAELEHALREERTEETPLTLSDGEVRLRALQAELIEAQRERIEREPGSEVNADAARHHEDLLRITYEVQAATLSPAEQRRASLNLLRDEAALAQHAYHVLNERQIHTDAAIGVEQSKPALNAQHDAVFRSVAWGISGALLGGLLGAWLFLHRHETVAQPFENHQTRHGGNPSAAGPMDVPSSAATMDGVSPPAKKVLESSVYEVVPRFTNESQRMVRVIDHSAGDGQPQSRRMLFETRWRGKPGALEEACRDAVYSILLADWGKGIRSYAVVSANDGDGKTTVLANMAMALARSGLRVVMLDADFRHPALHDIFFVDNRFGLMNILRSDVDLNDVPITQLTSRTWLSNVALIPMGESVEPAAVPVNFQRFADLVERLASTFDLVLVDTSSDSTEASAIAKSCGGTILLRSPDTEHDAARALRDKLISEQIYIAATIANNERAGGAVQAVEDGIADHV